MGKILLFYKYVTIESPKTTQKWIARLCQSLGLKGRIILAHEGINGTVGGSRENTAKFIETMATNPLFSGIDYKESEGGADCFPKLKVVVRDEIVRLRINPDELPASKASKHLTPQQAHTYAQANDPGVLFFDARNYFESKVGRFKNAHRAEIEYFRDLPAYIDQHLDLFKDKTVIMYCTGGIRCERGSAYLQAKNVAKQVYQIEGGIHRYCEQYPDGYFRGKNYVFDARVVTKINDDIIATCDLCGVANDDCTNCINTQCNKQIVSCPKCLIDFNNTCSATCKELVAQRKVIVRTKPAKIDNNEAISKSKP
jgi:predicted sulfurtransferase